MKKSKFCILLLLILFLGIVPMSNAQLRVGIRGDVGLNRPVYESNALKVKNLTTYSVGPVLEFLFPIEFSSIGAEVAVLYSRDGMTISRIGDADKDPIKVVNQYIDIPLNAKLKLGNSSSFQIFAMAGPYVSFKINSDKISFKDMSDRYVAREFSAGLGAGVGLELNSTIAVGVNWRILLTDDYKTDKPNWNTPLNGKKNFWSISLSFYL